MSSIIRSYRNGMYLVGWDLFGKPKFNADVKLANRMNYPTAKHVAENLRDVFEEGSFEVLPYVEKSIS